MQQEAKTKATGTILKRLNKVHEANYTLIQKLTAYALNTII